MEHNNNGILVFLDFEKGCFDSIEWNLLFLKALPNMMVDQK